MTLLFRTDASVAMGSGHVIRCLRLADFFRNAGIHCLFASRSHSGHLNQMIERSGYTCIALPSVYEPTTEPGSWLGVERESDVEDVVAICKKKAVDVVLVDHAAIDHRWEKAVSARSDVRVVVIDGQANRPHHCNLLIDPTFGPEGVERWSSLVPSYCEIYMGAQLHPLSAEFAKYEHGPDRSGDRPVSRILIAFGGGDSTNVTGKVLGALDELNRDVRMDIIVGNANPHLDELRVRADSHSSWFVHVQPPDFVDLMAAADIAIGAGGTMLWERCFLKLPSVVISLAANQERQCRNVAAAGAIHYLGPDENVVPEDIRDALLSLIDDSTRRDDLIAASARIIPSSPFDACGKVVERIKALSSSSGGMR